MRRRARMLRPVLVPGPRSRAAPLAGVRGGARQSTAWSVSSRSRCRSGPSGFGVLDLYSVTPATTWIRRPRPGAGDRPGRHLGPAHRGAGRGRGLTTPSTPGAERVADCGGRPSTPPSTSPRCTRRRGCVMVVLGVRRGRGTAGDAGTGVRLGTARGRPRPGRRVTAPWIPESWWRDDVDARPRSDMTADDRRADVPMIAPRPAGARVRRGRRQPGRRLRPRSSSSTRSPSRAAELSGSAEAGLVLADEDGRLHHIGSSDDGARLLELVQIQDEQGPCRDCYVSGVAVVETDLATASGPVAALRPAGGGGRVPLGARLPDAPARPGDRSAQRLRPASREHSTSRWSRWCRHWPTSRRSP